MGLLTGATNYFWQQSFSFWRNKNCLFLIPTGNVNFFSKRKLTTQYDIFFLSFYCFIVYNYFLNYFGTRLYNFLQNKELFFFETLLENLKKFYFASWKWFSISIGKRNRSFSQHLSVLLPIIDYNFLESFQNHVPIFVKI